MEGPKVKPMSLSKWLQPGYEPKPKEQGHKKKATKPPRHLPKKFSAFNIPTTRLQDPGEANPGMEGPSCGGREKGYRRSGQDRARAVEELDEEDTRLLMESVSNTSYPTENPLLTRAKKGRNPFLCQDSDSGGLEEGQVRAFDVL